MPMEGSSDLAMEMVKASTKRQISIACLNICLLEDVFPTK